MQRLYTYEHPRDGRRVEIFQAPRHDGLVYLIREGAGQDSVALDRKVMDAYRHDLSSLGYRLLETF